ncbi:MAG: TPM domain-containing protein, partial [Clostridia bacterium]|nr:TPM domain-containing protein [Clostridia bacterium]
MKFNRILAIVVTCLMVAGAMLIGLQGKPVSRDGSLYLTDKAGVISDSEEIRFAALQRELSPRLSVAIVKSTGKMSTAQYCETLWNNWHLGTSDLLLLMVTGEEDYYFGYDYSSIFAEVLDANFDLLMERYLEPDFAARDYESAIFAFSDGIQAVLSGAYFDNGTLIGDGYYGEYTTSSGTGMLVMIIFVILIIAVISAGSIGKKRPGSTVYHKPSAPGSYRPSGTAYRPSSTPRPGTSYRPSSTVRPSGTSFRPTVRPSSRPSRPGGFGGGGRSSGGFGGGGRSSGGFGGGGRSSGGF